MKANKKFHTIIFTAVLLALIVTLPCYAEPKEVKNTKETKDTMPRGEVIPFDSSSLDGRKIDFSNILEIEDGYLLLGWEEIFKIDRTGKVLWEQKFKELEDPYETGNNLLLYNDSLIYAAGFDTIGYGNNPAKIVKLRLDDGSIEWEIKLNNAVHKKIKDIQKSPQGLVALVRGDHGQQEDYFFTTLDLDGNILSTKEFFGFHYNPDQIAALPDGSGFFINTGKTIVRLDNDGKMLWQRYVGPSDYVSISLLKVIDGALYVGGDQWSSPWMVKLDLDAKLIWGNYLKPKGACRISKLRKTTSGKLVMNGYTCDGDKMLYWAGLYSEGGRAFEVKKFIPNKDNGFSVFWGQALPSNSGESMLFGYHNKEDENLKSLTLVKEKLDFQETP